MEDTRPPRGYGDPLDISHYFGPGDILFEVFAELQNYDDPLVIIERCEEQDEQEGWAVGTSLTLYFTHMTNTR